MNNVDIEAVHRLLVRCREAVETRDFVSPTMGEITALSLLLCEHKSRQPTPEAADTVYVYACPFCNEYKDGPTSLREHLLTCDVFSDAACGAPLLFVIQRRGRIIPNHYMNRENADAAIYKRGGTVIPLYHHPAHPPKPEPTEATEPNQLEKWAAFVVRTLKAAGPGSLGATGPKDNRHSMVLEILKRYEELPAKQYWKLT